MDKETINWQECRRVFWELGGLTDRHARDGLGVSDRTWKRYQQHGAPYRIYLALAALSGVLVNGDFKDWHTRGSNLISGDQQIRVNQMELYQVQLYRQALKARRSGQIYAADKEQKQGLVTIVRTVKE